MPKTETAAFRFKYAYGRTHFPASGYGMINGLGTSLLAEGVATLKAAAAGDTHLVARLGIPGSGATVDLRLVDGVLMRTLCAPGAKLPCGVDQFAAAALEGPAWRDSPFQEPTLATVKATAISGRRLESVVARKWADDSDEVATHAAIQARLSSLAVVEGVVYVRCVQPTLRFFMIANPEAGVSPNAKSTILQVGWHFADLDSFSSPHDGRKEKDSYGSYPGSGSRGQVKPPYPAAFADGMDEFGLDREGDARAFATSSAPEYFSAPPPAWPAVPYVDPTVLAPRVDDMARILEVVRKEVHHWSALSKLSDEKIHAWMGARRTLSRPVADLDEKEVRAAFDALSFAARTEGRSPHSYVTARSDALRRWDVVERLRDFDLGSSDDRDMDAIVGMAM